MPIPQRPRARSRLLPASGPLAVAAALGLIVLAGCAGDTGSGQGRSGASPAPEEPRGVAPGGDAAGAPAPGPGHDGTPAARPGGPPPGLIVLVSMDTLRADRLKLYGYGRETAPNLTALAGEALVFEAVAAQVAQTLLSHKSLFSSRYPLHIVHEATGADIRSLAAVPNPRDAAVRIFSRAPNAMLPPLQAAGYRTAAFTDGGWMRTAMGFAHGFDSYDDQGGGFGKIIPRTVQWLKANHPSAARPLFLFVHAYDIHCPYESREPFDTRFCESHGRHLDLAGRCGKDDLVMMDLGPEDLRAISDHYDGGIASADAWVGDLLDYLREAGLYDEAMIVVTSDHGDSLGEHGQIGHGGLYLEQLMVPLVVKLPASWSVQAGRIPEPAELVDVMPTILQAAGIDLPPGIDGRSLLPPAGGARSGRGYLTAQIAFREGRDGITSLSKRAIMEPSRWLVIYDRSTSRTEAFDLQADPAGLNNVAGTRPERMLALLAAMRKRDQAIAGEGGPVSPEALEGEPLEELLDEEILEELRSLGYID